MYITWTSDELAFNTFSISIMEVFSKYRGELDTWAELLPQMGYMLLFLAYARISATKVKITNNRVYGK